MGTVQYHNHDRNNSLLTRDNHSNRSALVAIETLNLPTIVGSDIHRSSFEIDKRETQTSDSILGQTEWFSLHTVRLKSAKFFVSMT